MQQRASSRVFNYFSVIGVGKKLMLQDANQQKVLDRNITGLEIIQIQSPADEINPKEGEKWLDLDGRKRLWLRATSDPSQRPITHIQFFSFQYEDEILKIPNNCSDFFPVPIRSLAQRKSENNRYLGKNDSFNFFQGNYDLSSLLDIKKSKGFWWVLCYRVQSQVNFDEPIADLQILQAVDRSRDAKRKTTYLSEKLLIIPNNYKVVEFAIGVGEKNRFISYKRRQPILERAFMAKIIDRYPILDYPDKPLMTMIPMKFCFPEGIRLKEEEVDPITFNFILTNENGVFTYCTCLTFYEKLPQDLHQQLEHVHPNKTYYHPKSICLVSSYNYSQQAKDLLIYLYTLHLSQNDIPLELTICNIIDDIRLPISSPNYGRLAVKYQAKQEIIFPSNLQYPICSEKAIQTLFAILGVDTILNLFEGILLEKSIHMISKHLSLPGIVAEALISFIFPFEYTHMLAPVLPFALRQYIEAPIPILVGYSQKNKSQNGNTNTDTIYVYLDSNHMVQMDPLPPLPTKPYNQLKKRLAKYENYYDPDKAKNFISKIDEAFPLYVDENGQPIEQLVQPFDVNDVRDAFFEFLLSLMKDYRKYFQKKQDTKIVTFAELYKVKEFLHSHGSTNPESFLYKFSETRFFTYFIQERAQMSEKQSYYEFFDKCLEVRKKKKHEVHIKKQTFVEVILCPGPSINNQAVQNQKYVYSCFPQMTPNLFVQVQGYYDDEGFQQMNKSFGDITQDELQKYQHLKWAKFLLENIYKIWFQLFIIKVRNNIEDERYENLTNYAIFLIQDMKQRGLTVPEIIFRYVFEACGYFLMDDKALFLIHEMKQMKVDAPPSIFQVYCLASTKGMAQKGVHYKNEEHQKQKEGHTNTQFMHHSQSQQNLPSHSTSTLQLGHAQSEMILPTLEDNHLPPIDPFEDCHFNITDMCPFCHRRLAFEEILEGFKKNYFENSTRCQTCKKDFNAKFQVSRIEDERQSDIEYYELQSPISIWKNLENLIKNKGETYLLNELFEKQQKDFFMSIILYLKLLNVPVFFFCVKVQPESYDHNFKQMELLMINQMRQHRKQNALLVRVFKDFDIYWQEVEKIGYKPQKEVKNSDQNSSSGSLGSSTKIAEKNVNLASVEIKKVFQDLIRTFMNQNDSKLQKPVQQTVQIKYSQSEEESKEVLYKV